MRLNVSDRPRAGNFMSGGWVCAGRQGGQDRGMLGVRRRWPWFAAALLHAGLLALIARCERPRELGETSMEMEVVEVAEAAEPDPDPDPDPEPEPEPEPEPATAPEPSSQRAMTSRRSSSPRDANSAASAA